jgi:hypothetical protein
MACQICGAETSAYRNRSRMVLCGTCHKTTPAKVTRDEFDSLFWVSDDPTEMPPPEGIRREFYEDYQASRHGSVAAYHRSTQANLPCWAMD